MRTYLGTNFEIWTGQQSWFWRFSDRNRGSIGAAASEADAVRDACRAIEETAATAPFRDWKYLEAAMLGWEFTLSRLEQYLPQVNCACR
jgi:hypothetical protein